MLSLVFKV